MGIESKVEASFKNPKLDVVSSLNATLAMAINYLPQGELNQPREPDVTLAGEPDVAGSLG